MEREVALKLIRSLEWPSEIILHVYDMPRGCGIIHGDVIGFINARDIGNEDLSDWEPAAVNIINATYKRANGDVIVDCQTTVPFPRIIRIEAP